VVSVCQKPEVEEILRKKAEEQNCPITFADRQQLTVQEEHPMGQTLSYRGITDIHCPLSGRYQQENVITAIEVIRALRACGFPVSDEIIRRGIEKTSWPGRFTCLSENPLFFIDGAHNEDAAKRLRESLETYFSGKRFLYLMGVFKDKEYEKIAQIMGPLAKSVHTIDLPDRNRTLPAEELAEVMRRHCSKDTKIQTEQSVSDAVTELWEEADTGDVILAFGSLSYLGNVMEAVKERNRK
jgi:dihydrofolate synthase/folylpolyglutamate synthase